MVRVSNYKENYLRFWVVISVRLRKKYLGKLILTLGNPKREPHLSERKLLTDMLKVVLVIIILK